MPCEKKRRTVVLAADRDTEIETIKSALGAATDTAAIDDAIRFRARLARRELSEVQVALAVWDVVKRESQCGRHIILDYGRPETDAEPVVTRIVVPSLG